MNRNFYTYCIIDPDSRQPFYVGKGSGTRMYEHNRVRSRLTNPLLKNKLCKLYQRGKKPVYEKVLINVSEAEAFQKEKELISYYGRLINHTGILCNLTEGGEGNSTAWTNVRRKILSTKMKGKRGYLPIIEKPVSQYSLDGKLLASFSSCKLASEVTKANASYISQCCKGKRRSAGGFLWCYYGSSPPIFSKKYFRTVRQLSLDGILIRTFRSLTAAQHATGVMLHNISECCRGKSKTAGGFIWQYC